MSTSTGSKPNSLTTGKKNKKDERFDKIRSTIDTGLHMGNVKIIALRQGEAFRRIKGSELANLVESQLEPCENIFHLIDDQAPDSPASKVSTTTRVISQNEEENANYNNQNQYQCPYLLLDIRKEKQYQQYHIRTSILYDGLNIRQDRLGTEIYRFKNKDDKIIVICCDDELEGIDIATQLTEKFISNVFLLSCSVVRFCGRFRQLCQGKNMPSEPNKNEPKVIHYDPTKTMKSKSKRKHHYNHKTNSKLNEANLESSNLNSMTSRSGISTDLQSTNSKMTKSSFVSTRTWMP